MNPSLSAPASAPPLDDKNLLQEILLRISPEPSSLPRASLVCKRWHHILSDPRFLRRFRKHHQRPPLLGFFSRHICGTNILYTPLLDSPNRIPADHFSMKIDLEWDFMGCRHGLDVQISKYRRAVIIWDPLTGKQQRVNFPPGFHFRDDQDNFTMSMAVLRSDDDNHPREHDDHRFSPFKLVLACHDYELAKAFTCTYKSESGAWEDVISTTTTNFVFVERPSILVGNALCWLLAGGDILEFDLERQTLAVIEKPAGANGFYTNLDWSFQILRGGNNGIGLAVLSFPGRSIHLWERNSNCDGVVSWVLKNTIKLAQFFAHPLLEKNIVLIPGYDEDTNVIFLSSEFYDFMIQLDLMQFRCIGRRKNKEPRTYYPYTDFFTAVKRYSGGYGRPENVQRMRSANVLCWLKRDTTLRRGRS